MSLHNHALYQVATKALIFKDDNVLVLHTPDGYLDFPGGRVDESELDIPWVEALKREIAEELGESVVVNAGQTLFVSKRQYHKDGKSNYIAAIFFKCEYISGEIKLSEEHGHHEWLSLEMLINHTLKFVSDDEKLQLRTLLNK